jgi:uncharacterized glyoxalase superfamily protein PhnB
MATKLKRKAKGSGKAKSSGNARLRSKVRPKMKARAKASARVKPIPERFNTVSAYLIVPNAVEALEFYQRALGAKTIVRMAGPGGQGTVHAEMALGDSMVMLADENPNWGAKSPRTLGATPVSLHLYVKDADALFQRAVAAGCTVQMPLQDMFWGDRFGKVQDPFGHVWAIATHKENVGEAELARRAAEAFAKMCAASEDSPQPPGNEPAAGPTAGADPVTSGSSVEFGDTP